MYVICGKTFQNKTLSLVTLTNFWKSLTFCDKFRFKRDRVFMFHTYILCDKTFHSWTYHFIVTLTLKTSIYWWFPSGKFCCLLTILVVWHEEGLIIYLLEWKDVGSGMLNLVFLQTSLPLEEIIKLSQCRFVIVEENVEERSFVQINKDSSLVEDHLAGTLQLIWPAKATWTHHPGGRKYLPFLDPWNIPMLSGNWSGKPKRRKEILLACG